MKRTTKINDLTLRPYPARVSPKFTVEVTFNHDALEDGYINEVSQELTRRQEGDEDLPRWQRRKYHRRSDIRGTDVRSTVEEILARAANRGLSGIVVRSVEVRSESLVAWTHEREGGE